MQPFVVALSASFLPLLTEKCESHTLFSFSVVPHITDAIQEWVMRQALIPVDEDGLEPQVCVIEVCMSLI